MPELSFLAQRKTDPIEGMYGDEREDAVWRGAMGISFPLLPLQPKETLSNWGALFFLNMYHKMEENHSFSSMLCRVLIMFHKRI